MYSTCNENLRPQTHTKSHQHQTTNRVIPGTDAVGTYPNHRQTVAPTPQHLRESIHDRSSIMRDCSSPRRCSRRTRRHSGKQIWSFRLIIGSVWDALERESTHKWDQSKGLYALWSRARWAQQPKDWMCGYFPFLYCVFVWFGTSLPTSLSGTPADE